MDCTPDLPQALEVKYAPEKNTPNISMTRTLYFSFLYRLSVRPHHGHLPHYLSLPASFIV